MVDERGRDDEHRGAIRAPGGMTPLVDEARFWIVVILLLVAGGFLRAHDSRLPRPEPVPATFSAAIRTLEPPPDRDALSPVPEVVPWIGTLVLRAAFELDLGLTSRDGSGRGERLRFQTDALRVDGRATDVARAAWFVLEIVSIVALAAAGRRLLSLLRPGASTGWAWLGPGVLAITPLALDANRRLDPAVVCITFACLSLWCLLRVRGRGRWLGGGLALGVAAFAHPAGAALIPLLLVGLVPDDERTDGATTGVVIGIVAFAVGALLAEPRLVDGAALAASRARAALIGPPPIGRESPLFSWWRGVTPVPVVFGALGAVALVAGSGRAIGRRRAVAAIVFVLVSIALLPGTSRSAAMMALPLVGLAASVGGAWGARRAPFGAGSTVLGVVAVLAWPAVAAWGDAHRDPGVGTRAAAQAWIDADLPEGSRVVADAYGPDVPNHSLRFVLPFDAQVPEVYAAAYDLGWYEEFDTFIFVGTQQARYARDPDRHRSELGFVERVRSISERVAAFGGDGSPGPRIEVYRRDRPVERGRLAALLDQPNPQPPNVEFFLSLGAIHGRMGEEALAAAFYRAASRVDGTDPRVALNVSSMFLRAGNLMAADSLLTAAVRRYPEDARLRYQFGLVKSQRQLVAEAIGQYKMAVRYDPTFVRAYLHLGASYYDAGNLEGARNSLRRVLELDPDSEEGREAARITAEIADRVPR